MSTLLHRIASTGNYDELVQALQNPALDKNAKNANGETPLHIAASKGYVEVASALVDAGGDINQPNNEKLSSLHVAAASGHADVVSKLLEKGAHVYAMDSNSWMALHHAAYNGHINCVKALVGEAAALSIPSALGHTPVHLAAYRGFVDCVLLLVEKGARIDLKDSEKNTPLALLHVRPQTDSNTDSSSLSRLADLSESLGDLLGNEAFSDCSVHVGDVHIPAHKVILAARCDHIGKLVDPAGAAKLHEQRNPPAPKVEEVAPAVPTEAAAEPDAEPAAPASEDAVAAEDGDAKMDTSDETAKENGAADAAPTGDAAPAVAPEVVPAAEAAAAPAPAAAPAAVEEAAAPAAAPAAVVKEEEPKKEVEIDTGIRARSAPGSVVIIDGADEAAVRALLEFVYSGKVAEFEASAGDDLLGSAFKVRSIGLAFKLTSLVQYTESIIEKCISVSNVVSFLENSTSALNTSARLARFVAAFVLRRFNEVVAGGRFMQLPNDVVATLLDAIRPDVEKTPPGRVMSKAQEEAERLAREAKAKAAAQQAADEAAAHKAAAAHVQPQHQHVQHHHIAEAPLAAPPVVHHQQQAQAPSRPAPQRTPPSAPANPMATLANGERVEIPPARVTTTSVPTQPDFFSPRAQPELLEAPHGLQRVLTPKNQQHCQSILNQMKKDKGAIPYMEAVDVVKFQIPQYLEIVKNPMDLGTVSSKLSSGQYATAEDFGADVVLIFDDAMTFNPPKTPYYTVADRLKKKLYRLWNKANFELRDADGNEVQIGNSNGVSKKKKRESMAAPVQQRAWSLDDKQRLGANIGQLTEDQAENVVVMISRVSRVNPTGEGVFEIDLDELDNNTLTKVSDYVNGCLGTENKKRRTN
eukprot:TRINITY_DN4688_c0_g1_i2.p1 TRINITY_DN4688_c0_g1~~TRINITY_DN4688_c0_g1_i2.p1  ORF type:complete len:867 (-),score=317.40 TRINITY_DN4688_c0_g1_i2:364-2964(-)